MQKHDKEQAGAPRAPEQNNDALTELMKGHLDDVTGGLVAGHNSWKQRV